MNQSSITTHTWEFDSYSAKHWQEIKAGNVDETKSWIDFSETEDGRKITVFINKEPQIVIDAYRDQWGTWITFEIDGHRTTVAQEDGTMSFIDSLIASLIKLKRITDFETTQPVFTEFLSEGRKLEYPVEDIETCTENEPVKK